MSPTANLARLLEAFFTDRLIRQRQASPHTIAAYRDAFRLLLGFARQRLEKEPSALGLEDLDPRVIGAFLDDLEKRRGNTARSRNARLAAIHSFFRYAALEEPSHSAVIQRVLAMPSKRCGRKLVGFLTRIEIDALLAAPDRTCWSGRRDHALILLAVRTGLRVSDARLPVLLGESEEAEARAEAPLGVMTLAQDQRSAPRLQKGPLFSSDFQSIIQTRGFPFILPSVFDSGIFAFRDASDASGARRAAAPGHEPVPPTPRRRRQDRRRLEGIPEDVEEDDRMQTIVVRVTALGTPLRGDDDATEGALLLRSRCGPYEPR